MKNIIIVFLVLICSLLLLNKTSAVTIDNKIGIDIKGAVTNPGYYNIDDDTTVYDAISLAGGLTNYADTSVINLSKKLHDEDAIVIYTIDEVSSMKKGDTAIKVIDKECVCPKINNVACLNTNTEQININTATTEQLMTLSGIGKSKALSIIKYRELTPFHSITDITKVKGIGTSIYAKIKDNITV